MNPFAVPAVVVNPVGTELENPTDPIKYKYPPLNVMFLVPAAVVTDP